jgi:hypothetical protein
LQAHSEFVKKNEPGTLKYELNLETKPSGAKEAVVVEMWDFPYSDQEVTNIMQIQRRSGLWRPYVFKGDEGSWGSVSE